MTFFNCAHGGISRGSMGKSRWGNVAGCCYRLRITPSRCQAKDTTHSIRLESDFSGGEEDPSLFISSLHRVSPWGMWPDALP